MLNAEGINNLIFQHMIAYWTGILVCNEGVINRRYYTMLSTILNLFASYTLVIPTCILDETFVFVFPSVGFVNDMITIIVLYSLV